MKNRVKQYIDKAVENSGSSKFEATPTGSVPLV
jgi:hypothetical protein